MIRARVITCSDGVVQGSRQDRSGPALRELLEQSGYAVDLVTAVPDDVDAIAAAIESAAGDGARLVVTTGGTGIAPRDVTPEATARVADRVLPGFGEAMRAASKTPMAVLSRAMAATRGATLIVNVPGSPSGAVECLGAVLRVIPHAVELLSGERVEVHPVKDEG